MDYMYGVWTVAKYAVIVVAALIVTTLVGYGVIYAMTMNKYGEAPTDYQMQFCLCFGVIFEMVVGFVGFMLWDIISSTAKERREKRERAEKIEREKALEWERICNKFEEPAVIEFHELASENDKQKVATYIRENHLSHERRSDGTIITTFDNAKAVWCWSGAYCVLYHKLNEI